MNSPDDNDVLREIVVRNQSTVPAEYAVTREEHDRDPVFSVYDPLVTQPSGLASGTIPPQSEVNLVIRYTPTTAGTYTEENYSIVTPGGNTEKLVFSARCVSPIVEIYKKEDPFAGGFGVPNSLNFRDIHVGEVASKVLYFKNTSDLPAAFCVCAEEFGLFNFSQTRGVIPPNFESSILLTFSPKNPGNFYKRVFVLIENAQPQFIDLLGSGYINARGEIKEQRPAPIRHAHIQAFRNRVAAGLGKIGPGELEAMYAQNKMSKLFAGVGPKGTQPLGVADASKPVTRSGDTTRNSVAVAREFFADATDPRSEITLDTRELDFSYHTADGSPSVSQTVTLTNNCKEKVSVNWFIPAPEDGDKLKDFVVSPPIADILPHSKQTFQVQFKPCSDNFYYCQELEAVVFFKSQRSFRLVTDATLQPPWNLVLRTLGHSFSMEQFLPKISISVPHNKLTFPATFVGDSSFQTVRITNMGNLPAHFAFPPPSPDSPFTVKPWGGLIPADDFQLVTINFSPTTSKHYFKKLSCMLNNTPSMSQIINVFGSGELPRLVVKNTTKSGSLYLKPTCVGLSSTRELVVHNPTRVPLIFRVSLPASLDGTVVSATPRSCRLQGNESTKIIVTFAPRASSTYRCKLHIKVRAVGGEAPDLRDARQIGQAENSPILQSIGVTLVCPGAAGAVNFDPPNLDFGVKLVNYNETRVLRLTNASDCDLKYQILHHLGEGPDGASRNLRDAYVPLHSKAAATGSLMIMDQPAGILPARSTLVTHVTFSPSNHGVYKFDFVCRVARVDGEGNEVMIDPAAKSLLDDNRDALLGDDYYADLPGVNPSGLPLTLALQGSAAFPTLVMRDVRSHKGGIGMASSTDFLFGQLGLPEINKTLSTPLTRKEVEFNLLSSPDLSLLPSFNFDFTPAPKNSDQQVIYLELVNPAPLPVTFSLHMPNEKAIELETWADEGEPSPEEIKINRIIDELKVFDVYPKNGELKSGESLTITISYAYTSLDFEGLHELPILLRVFQGKQFWLKCRGRTLKKDQPCVVPRTRSIFTDLKPVAVGTRPHAAPLQLTELCNVGAVPVEYKVDEKMIQKFNQKEGYGMEVLRLENARGFIDRGKSVLLRWRFMPLEVKTCELAVGVKIFIGKEMVDKQTLKIKVKGYLPGEEDPHAEVIPAVNLGLLPPPCQFLKLPAQTATLSVDRLVFGRMPQRSSSTKIAVLKNDSGKALRFNLNRHEWQGDDVSFSPDSISSASGVVHVYPSEGVVEAGKQQILKITVDANCFPRHLDHTLAVELLEQADDPSAKPPPNAADKQNERIAQLKAASKIGEGPHSAVVSTETLSRIGAKLENFLKKAAQLSGRYEVEERMKVLTEAYILLTGIATKNQTSENFFDTVIRKLVKVGMKDDIDEMVSEGIHMPLRSLDDIMEELEDTYSRRRKEPEVKLAFMLYGIDEVDLPATAANPNSRTGTAGGGGGSDSDAVEGKVSFQSSFAGSANSGMLPSTGMRGTMLMPRNNNKKKTQDLAALKPAKTFIFMHITAEIVEEESYFQLFGGDLGKDGVTIPTTREFIYNPYELTPAGLVEAKDEFIVEGSSGELGGSKESAAVRSLVSAMFSELVGSNDVLRQIDELPVNPRNPYLGEVQQKQPLMTALQAAFDLFDVDANGTLTNSEITNALKHLGLSCRNAEVKSFLKELDKNGDNEVDMREFLAGLTKEMAAKIANAMETNEDMIIALRAERQQKMAELASPKASPRSASGRKASQQAVALGLVAGEEVEVLEEGIAGNAEEDNAALMIQQKSRMRTAKQEVEQKRFLNSDEGKEMSSAALMIQGRARQRNAKRDLAKAAEAKRKAKLGEASLSEDLRSMVPRILNETIFNLLREALETPICDRQLEKLERQLEEQEKLAAEGSGEGARAAWGTDTLGETGRTTKKGGKGAVFVEEETAILDEDELAEIEMKIEDLKRMPRFDLNLQPKTFVALDE